MFSRIFNKRMLKSYRKVFTHEKMMNLYAEFKTLTNDQLKRASKTKDKEELRFIFHSLKSSSLVFGMVKFSKCNAQLEQKVLDGKELLAKEIEECTMLYKRSLEKVDAYLRGPR